MTSSFDYIQARLQARHGQRPGEERWRLMESATDLGSYLQYARATALSPWVQHLPPQADFHQIERSLRNSWHGYTEEVAGWAPEEWRPAIRWTARLPELPHISHLARGGSVRPWMLEDPELAPLAMEDFQRRREALSASPFSAVAEAIAGNRSPIDAWLDSLESAWPLPEAAPTLNTLRQLLENHIRDLQQEPGRRTTGPGLRGHFIEQLTALFRRESGRIGAVFAHLALTLLDLERLRGGLVLRALFPDPQERPQWA